MNKNKMAGPLAGAFASLGFALAAPAADVPARGPFDAKAREMLEHVIAIPT